MVTSPRYRALTAPGWTQDPLWTRARMMPSFDIDASRGELPIDRISGQNLTTFTRAASATYVDVDGVIRTAGANVLRRQWDATNQRWGWLVEEARTNLLLMSAEINDAAWNTKFNVTVSANAATAPDGTQTADSVIPNAMTSLFYVSQSVTTVASTVYTFSFYAKANGFSWVFADAFDGTNRRTWFNLSNGTLGTVASGTTAAITSAGNGWYRCSISLPAGTTSIPYAIAITSNNNVFSGVVGDGVKSVFVWGGQVEAGAFPTSYIATGAATATRDADVWTWTTLPTVRSLYAEFTSPASGARGVASLNDNSANQRIALSTSGTDPLLTVVDGGVTQASVDAGTVVANARSRIAARFAANDFAVSINGAAEVTDTSGTVPVVDRLFLGRSQASEYLNGGLSRLIGWNTALPMLSELTR